MLKIQNNLQGLREFSLISDEKFNQKLSRFKGEK